MVFLMPKKNVQRGGVARAKRHYIPGHIWHITHRCHKREFLLKFAKDRKYWLDWRLEAKRRYGLSILNYVATSNHIHLLVVDDGDRDVIPRSKQLTAGRTGQRYNSGKSRKGAFWEDRYHATAIQRGDREAIFYSFLRIYQALRCRKLKKTRLWVLLAISFQI